ncbi:MAG: oligosaccharide flippase family protein [Crocinitomicaceae bacterium]
MGVVQREASRTALVSYIGLILGYVNKGVLFVLILSQEEVGLINLIVAVATLFAQFTNLGVLNAIPRFYPFLKNPDRQNYGFFAFNFYVVVVGTVLMIVSLLLLEPIVINAYGERSPLFVDYYYWIIPTGIGVLWYRFLDIYLRVLYKNVVSVIANDLLLRIATLGLIAFYAMNWIAFDDFLMLICLFHFIPMVILVAYLYLQGELKIKLKSIQIPRRLKKIIFSYSFYSYLNSLGAMAIITIDAMMVASLIGLAETGVYTTVVFVTRALMIPYGSITRVSAPLVAQYWKDSDMNSMQSLYRKTSSVSIFIGLMLFLGVWVNREVLFGLLPEGYEAGIYVFLFLMIGRLIDSFFGLNGYILITSKKYKFDMLFTAVLFVLVIVLNIVLIPVWGMYGAAISTAIAMLVYNVLRVAFVYRNYKIHPFMIDQLFVLIIFGCSLLGAEYLVPEFNNNWISLLVNSAYVGVTFPLMIVLFRVEPESANYVRKQLRRFK